MRKHKEAPEAPEPEADTELDAATPEELAELWDAEAPPKSGPIANAASSLVVLALAVAGVILSIGLDLGTPQTPKAGMWPFIVSIIIGVMALVQLLVGRRGGEDGEKFSSYSWFPLIGFATLILLVILMPVIGFEVPALLLSFVWMRWLGGERWRSATLYSLIVVVIFYLIFIVALGTSIPHLI
ncbi:tripartite tricarboxylate transporter TctB family protein [Glutamicibacter halophytocola]|uniref:tripartite tricarboxylate transporter TctB family protein n=1 Tax=Glutamicibacter halophytocola TaxID=1933880 RepID=UPI0015597AF2|nr:tripartite tricarboxylate transporter TctB family protein [Glutamicibacter halophytocola]NQD41794.1 tripartite tricarboxylate transporter TctB family protein [Glutamicibacter halophytocola]